VGSAAQDAAKGNGKKFFRARRAGYNPCVPTVTRIVQSKRRPNWQQIYLNGQRTFACKTTVATKWNLRIGINLDNSQVQEIQHAELVQECRDAALNLLSHRLHSEAELSRKLLRKEYEQQTIDTVLDSLRRLGYLDDQRFAMTKTLSAMQHKQHGRRRAYVELLKSGVKSDVATRALDGVYNTADSAAVARQLAMKKAVSLRKLDPITARRRLAGMLQRRGFDYETIKPVIEEVLSR
jgi:regulatory protein